MPSEPFMGTAPFTTVMHVRAAAKISPAAAKPANAQRSRSRGNEVRFLVLVAALLALAIVVASSGRFTAGSNLGYWIGVAGGVAMLLLFLYPLRKRW